MNDTRKTIYEPHPVSEDRLAELQQGGYQIIDAVFNPNPAVEADQADKPKPGRKPKAVEAEQGE